MIAFCFIAKLSNWSCYLVAYFKLALIRSMKEIKNKTLASNKKQQQKYSKTKLIQEVSKTGDIKTNDFDLVSDKKPALSTIRTQIKNAKNLIESGYSKPIRTEFDRLRMGINLSLYETQIEFKDLYLEDVPNPKEPPSYVQNKEQNWELLHNALKEIDNISNKNKDKDIDNDNYTDREIDDILLDDYSEENTPQAIISEDISSSDTTLKKRIRYDDYSKTIGLTNLFIDNGYLVIDITGKFMHGPGELGSLNKDNIKEALQKIIDLHVISFDIKKFIKYAHVFVCDVCVDILLENKTQVLRYIDGVSSFFPIATNRFDIKKYGRHGLTLKPKAESSGYSLAIYSKWQELNSSVKRSTKATRYTNNIGDSGIEIAERTLRLEVKLFKLKNIRSSLNIATPAEGFVRLTDVLNSTTPVMIKMFELFSGNPQELLSRLDWLHTIVTKPDGLTLSEIFIAERFIEIFKANNLDLNLTRSHIRTEYINVSDTELEYFNRLSNLRQNILNFLVYRKPKSITIMLDLITMLYAYYSAYLETDTLG